MKRKKYLQQLYYPHNRNKYTGKIPIRTRSSWEFKFAQFLDANPKILEWSFESLWITYYHPGKKRPAKYLPDFWVRTANDIFVIEIGNHSLKTIRSPSRSKNAKTRAYANMMRIVNEAKFQAAEEYCSSKGWKFKVVTEKQMFQYE